MKLSSTTVRALAITRMLVLLVEPDGVRLAYGACNLTPTNNVIAQAEPGDDSAPTVLLDGMRHYRNGPDPEWDEFTDSPDAERLEVTFESVTNAAEWTLRLVQENVKQPWEITLNDQRIGRLQTDENPMVAVWAIPPQALRSGQNTLRIQTTSATADDIRLGDVMLIPEAWSSVCSAAVQVTVRDADSGQPTPCRITVLNNDRLMTVGAESSATAAVRPGVLYSKGTATFGLPEGTYTILAGRGPEYSLAEQTVAVTSGQSIDVSLQIRREVKTAGWVSCDTHVHTLTHSGHGDATIEERMLTLAGECIELPIATDHNKHIDYRPTASTLGVARYFTPVIGNEVTTRTGHFNVFPVASAETPIPDFRSDERATVFDSILATPDVRVIILNHARDVHSGYRPFGPENHLASTGETLDGRILRVNAMELINSGAQQTDMMRLPRDWMGLLTAGNSLTPVGCSDSHDVARHFAGQARTYIRCDDTDAGRIDATRAVQNFLEGRVTVSCGLFCFLTVNKTAEPGDLAPSAEKYSAQISVAGPSWAQAEEVELFVNGESVSVLPVPAGQQRAGNVKLETEVTIPVSDQHDAFVVAVARGPGVRGLFWPIARPYQPTSTHWQPQNLAITGAIWIDADGDGRRTAPRETARRLYDACQGDFAALLQQLESCDSSVALHVASFVMTKDATGYSPDEEQLLKTAAAHIRNAFLRYADEKRDSLLRQLEN
ncbi:MAG: CehA/McbA family metallohydrolase [Planctomycetaceae bacterium]|nr:CehA/McbA family metallohydrolase [Planctomycetaceae bacterium]